MIEIPPTPTLAWWLQYGFTFVTVAACVPYSWDRQCSITVARQSCTLNLTGDTAHRYINIMLMLYNTKPTWKPPQPPTLNKNITPIKQIQKPVTTTTKPTYRNMCLKHWIQSFYKESRNTPITNKNIPKIQIQILNIKQKANISTANTINKYKTTKNRHQLTIKLTNTDP